MKDVSSGHKCVIAIPVYRVPTEMERKSFRQCLKILFAYDVAIVTHDGVDLSILMGIAAEYGKEIKTELFAKHFFAGIEGYNSLCMDKSFYQRFADTYEYMLIYQLDAWVFSDQLREWCNKGYNYVGAPFFLRDDDGRPTDMLVGVGNGGFSLRRLRYCMDVLELPKRLPYLTPASLFKRVCLENKYIGGSARKTLSRFTKAVLMSFGWRNTLGYLVKNGNEDSVFSYCTAHSWLTLLPPPHMPLPLICRLPKKRRSSLSR